MYNEVPRDYRRNYTEEAANLLGMLGIITAAITFFGTMLICF